MKNDGAFVSRGIGIPQQPLLPTKWRLNIGGKVILLFLVLALIGAGSWLVVARALSQLDGTAAEINLYGSLRYLSQSLHAVAHEIADEGRDPADVERLIGEFETTLSKLQRNRGAREAGPALGGEEIGGDGARRALAVVGVEWPVYRDAARRFAQSRTKLANEAAEHRQLTTQAAKLLALTIRATSALTDEVTRLQRKAQENLLRLAMIDAVVLISSFVYIRRRIVRPLRELSGVTLRFANGDYGARSDFRSHDEIGRLAEAFDHMAVTTEDHIKIIAADLDVIRREKAELHKLTQAIEHSPAAVMITDTEGRIEYVNPRFTEITGYDSKEAVGQPAAMLKSGLTLSETYTEMWQTLGASGVWRGELLNRKKNGELFWENTQISPVRNEAGETTHYVSVKEDTTERKHAEQALAMLNIELEQRVAARTRQIEAANRELQAFSHSVSQDLRTPLRAILGFAQAIEEDGGDSLKGHLPDYLRRIQAAAVRMGELIDDLLELGRVGQVELMAQPVNLGRMAREILDRLARREPGRHVEIEVDEPIVVDGDPRLLRVAMENLLDNAWKFTADRDPARITFGHARQGSAKVLVVRDNGAGFNMDYADKLFRPFQRLHAEGRFPGKAIGLATVKRVIDLHGGRIWAEGEADKGAGFYFELPENPAQNQKLPENAKCTELQ